MKNLEQTKIRAQEIIEGIQFSIEAHIYHPLTDKKAIRSWDKVTPYIVHPTWCAMTILCETLLPEALRWNGCQALLWHDVLEDTEMVCLPENTTPVVVDYVNEMTFRNFSEEVDAVWKKSKEIHLFKLYDKTSNLLDGSWMTAEKWQQYIQFTLKLASDVEVEYGLLNIVKIARSIAVVR